MPAFEMEWRDVFFASYPVDPSLVTPQIPDRLDVDTFEGDAYLSVVPFVIADIRPRGFPAAVGLTTPELNLRTYVTCDGQRGIYFFNLDAGDLLGVIGARLFNHLPYYYASMQYDPGAETRFQSRRRTPGVRPLSFDATYSASGESFQPDPGTVEQFLVERYRYFTQAQDSTVRYANIDHEPWRLRQGAWHCRENDLFEANGFDQPDTEPILSHSEGVSVVASASKRWER